MIKSFYKSRELILDLAKNDFKTKYAGAQFGIVWGFIQPIMTILVFWFVFQVGFKTAPVKDIPYVLWLVTGLVPWFFFSEALVGATNTFVEYSYLVKKVVFNIEILPIVKIISALFIHIFFLVFTIIMFMLYKIPFQLSYVQVLYYSFCMVILIIGISYITSATVIFFRDLTQIINIVIQFGMWLTPILWDIEMIPVEYAWIFKLNPMYYIITGFRDSFISGIWFWDRGIINLYFWIVTLLLFVIGNILFKKLKPHFADVL